MKKGRKAGKTMPAAGTGPSARAILGVKIFILIAVTVVIYIPAISAEFVWDDDYHLIDNVMLKDNALYRIWCTNEAFVYYPITWTSYYFEHMFWGLNPVGYHIVSILQHILCALLIWRILVLLKIPCAWLAAFFFAVHPVNVESVAWITQRKNLLSMLFFLTVILCYLRFDDSGRRRWYVMALVSFILAMLSKGAVVMLPFILLLLAWWLHGRITRRDLLRSVPFFAVSAAIGVIEIWFQTVNVIGETIVRDDTLPARIASAGWVVWFYAYKALIPVNLCFLYPRWQIDVGNLLSYIPSVGLLGVFILFWIYRRSWGRPLLFAFGYFVLMVTPATGFAHFYFLRYSFVADHYQYMAIIGMIALVAAVGYYAAIRLGTGAAEFAKVVSVILVVVLSSLSWRQSGIYKDTETLWHDTLKKNPNAWLAHNNLGTMLTAQGKLIEATYHYQQAVSARPDFAEAQFNLGNALKSQGKYEEALFHLKEALQLGPESADVHNDAGVVLKMLGRFDEAISHFRKVLELSPDYVKAYNNIGGTFYAQGKFKEAVDYFCQALDMKPDYVMALVNIERVLMSHPDRQLYDAERFIGYAERAAVLTRNQDFQVLMALAEFYAADGQFNRAIEIADKAVKLAVFAGNNAMVKEIRSRIQLYRQGQSYIRRKAT
jgi:tetratricopeptide (TPR) repeat protein